ncbi:MAG: hypothetical protein QW561_03435 [Candidatus Aenigmatarchaeota archaeon]
MGGGRAPEVPREQRRLLRTQEEIARKEWAMKEPVLQMFAGWTRGEPIPSYYVPRWEEYIEEGRRAYGGLITAIESAYRPVREAISRYYGAGFVAPAIETAEREAARMREEAVGMRGLPTTTARRLEEIETWRAGRRIEAERIGNLARAAADIALETQLGTEKADIERALAMFELSVREQAMMYEPELRLGAMQAAAGLPAEDYFARISGQWLQRYEQELGRWRATQQNIIDWIKAFAELGYSVGVGGGPLGAGFWGQGV